MPVEKSKAERSRCFFDIQIDGEPVGRIVMELFDDLVPRTTENFLMLCTGQAGIGKVTGKPLHFKGSLFHRVIKNFMIQGGDFTAGNGTGGESIYGGVFDDESFKAKHDQPFMLSMANRGKDTNGSQFFITTKPARHLDNIHVVFGKVISGDDVVTQIENLKVNTKSRPLADVVIANCGQLIRKKAAKEAEAELEEKDSSAKKKHKKEKKARRDKDSDYEERKATPPPEVPKNEPENISSVKPEDLPEVPTTNKFLMRRSKTPEGGRTHQPMRGANIVQTRSGHRVKGRGAIRFRTPSDDEAPVRSRSATPPHWRREERRLITLKEFDQRIKEKLELEEKKREVAKQQSIKATNEIETFGYRLPVFPPVPQMQSSQQPIEKDRSSHTATRRGDRAESEERRWPNDQYLRGRDKDMDRERVHREKPRSRSPPRPLRNGTRHEVVEQSTNRHREREESRGRVRDLERQRSKDKGSGDRGRDPERSREDRERGLPPQDRDHRAKEREKDRSRDSRMERSRERGEQRRFEEERDRSRRGDDERERERRPPVDSDRSRDRARQEERERENHSRDHRRGEGVRERKWDQQHPPSSRAQQRNEEERGRRGEEEDSRDHGTAHKQREEGRKEAVERGDVAKRVDDEKEEEIHGRERTLKQEAYDHQQLDEGPILSREPVGTNEGDGRAEEEKEPEQPPMLQLKKERHEHGGVEKRKQQSMEEEAEEEELKQPVKRSRTVKEETAPAVGLPVMVQQKATTQNGLAAPMDMEVDDGRQKAVKEEIIRQKEAAEKEKPKQSIKKEVESPQKQQNIEPQSLGRTEEGGHSPAKVPPPLPPAAVPAPVPAPIIAQPHDEHEFGVNNGVKEERMDKGRNPSPPPAVAVQRPERVVKIDEDDESEKEEEEGDNNSSSSSSGSSKSSATSKKSAANSTTSKKKKSSSSSSSSSGGDSSSSSSSRSHSASSSSSSSSSSASPDRRRSREPNNSRSSPRRRSPSRDRNRSSPPRRRRSRSSSAGGRRRNRSRRRSSSRDARGGSRRRRSSSRTRRNRSRSASSSRHRSPPSRNDSRRGARRRSDSRERRRR